MNAADREASFLLERRPTLMSRNRGLRLALPPPVVRAVGFGNGFGVSVLSGKRRTVLRPMGELDLSTAGLLETAVVEVLAEGTPEVVLDLRRLDFCDAAGLQAFLRVRRCATESGSRLWLECPTRTVRRVLELCDLDWLLG